MNARPPTARPDNPEATRPIILLAVEARIAIAFYETARQAARQSNTPAAKSEVDRTRAQMTAALARLESHRAKSLHAIIVKLRFVLEDDVPYQDMSASVLADLLAMVEGG